jgi:hypothetical protein
MDIIEKSRLETIIYKIVNNIELNLIEKEIVNKIKSGKRL